MPGKKLKISNCWLRNENYLFFGDIKSHHCLVEKNIAVVWGVKYNSFYCLWGNWIVLFFEGKQNIFPQGKIRSSVVWWETSLFSPLQTTALPFVSPQTTADLSNIAKKHFFSFLFLLWKQLFFDFPQTARHKITTKCDCFLLSPQTMSVLLFSQTSVF